MFSSDAAYVQNMQNSEDSNTDLEPAIIGYMNDQYEFHWKFNDRLLKFISNLPESRQYPLIAHMEHELGDELAVLVIHHEDLKKSQWHTLNDYR